MGVEPPNSLRLGRVVGQFKKEGYVKDSATISSNGPVFVELTGHGREQARANADPFQEVHSQARRSIASEGFATAYPGAFEPWADAERLLWVDDAEAQLTTIGHKIREATQAFATALVNQHGASAEPDVTKVELRLGSVIAIHRPQLGEAHRGVLEALGNLWETTNKLIQRQEHGD